MDPDYQYIGHPSVPLPGLNINTTTTVAGATTTVSGSTNSTISTATTSASTTTVQQTNYTKLAIQAAIKGDQNYALLLNFSTIYNATPNCTPQVYNNSYYNQFHTYPVVPLDFINVSIETPYAMTQRIVANSASSYTFEFVPSVTDPNFNGVPALTIGITVTSPGASSAVGIVETNSYGGIFQGASYSSLSSLYQKSAAINNACSAMVG